MQSALQENYEAKHSCNMTAIKEHSRVLKYTTEQTLASNDFHTCNEINKYIYVQIQWYRKHSSCHTSTLQHMANGKAKWKKQWCRKLLQRERSNSTTNSRLGLWVPAYGYCLAEKNTPVERKVFGWNESQNQLQPLHPHPSFTFVLVIFTLPFC